MIVRTITLAGGLFVGAGTSQFPEFSQQYAQRLGGAVDDLSEVVADFDASAEAEGLSRTQATCANYRCRFYRTAARRYGTYLQSPSCPYLGPEVVDRGRAIYACLYAARFTDGDVVNAAWSAFQPAIPLNLAGVIFAGFGFLVGLISISCLLVVIRWPFSRRTA